MSEPLAYVNPLADGLVGGCVVCGQQPVPFDFRVEDDIWNAVHMPADWKRDVVCLPCFAEMAGNQGIDIGPHLLVLYFTGGSKKAPKTTAFVPALVIGSELAQARAELDGLRAWKRSVDEALNSGDGAYRP